MIVHVGELEKVRPTDMRARISTIGFAGVRGEHPAVERKAVPSWPLPAGVRDTTFEQGIVAATNDHRRIIGVQEVKYDGGGALDYCAGWKSLDMAKWMYLQHDQPEEKPPDAAHPSTVSDRFIHCGYLPSGAWGENAAYGLQSPEMVVNAWLSDIGHRQNVENSSWTVIGVGVVFASNGLAFSTQDFGTEHDPVSPAPPPPPAPTGPQVGEHWWNKTTHKEFVVDVLRTVNARPWVFFHRVDEQPEKRKTTVADFTKRFTKERP